MKLLRSDKLEAIADEIVANDGELDEIADLTLNLDNLACNDELYDLMQDAADLVERSIKTKKPIVDLRASSCWTGYWFLGTIAEVEARLNKELAGVKEEMEVWQTNQTLANLLHEEEAIKSLQRQLKEKQALVAKAKKAKGKTR